MTGTGAHERLKNKFVEDLGLESSIPLFLIQSRTWQNWSCMLVHDEQSNNVEGSAADPPPPAARRAAGEAGASRRRMWDIKKFLPERAWCMAMCSNFPRSGSRILTDRAILEKRAVWMEKREGRGQCGEDYNSPHFNEQTPPSQPVSQYQRPNPEDHKNPVTTTINPNNQIFPESTFNEKKKPQLPYPVSGRRSSKVSSEKASPYVAVTYHPEGSIITAHYARARSRTVIGRDYLVVSRRIREGVGGSLNVRPTPVGKGVGADGPSRVTGEYQSRRKHYYGSFNEIEDPPAALLIRKKPDKLPIDSELLTFSDLFFPLISRRFLKNSLDLSRIFRPN
ncbi:unnamed protein product [Phyllotreta striolata]|uniref:Uncharacterized protein n=1 Tax=Phyllotreta striolata TaxID=444603 RepID=A0A9N9TJ51_PHYSR|nr:unnamed protein product [Phyllotreta striolata]